MAAIGQVREDYWEGCDAARVKWVDRFRAYVRSIPADKQGARAARLGIPKSTLSNYWSGRRVPSIKDLRLMHATAFGRSTRLEETLSELEGLQPAASRRRSAAPGSTENAALRIATTPPAEQAGSSATSAEGNSGTVSASRPATDRHSTTNRVVRETVDALTAAHAAGDRRTLLTLTWSASKTLSATELCAAVGEFHASRRPDLAEAVLLGGQDRSHEDAMRLTLTLISAGLTEHAEMVIRAALPPAPR